MRASVLAVIVNEMLVRRIVALRVIYLALSYPYTKPLLFNGVRKAIPELAGTLNIFM